MTKHIEEKYNMCGKEKRQNGDRMNIQSSRRKCKHCENNIKSR